MKEGNTRDGSDVRDAQRQTGENTGGGIICLCFMDFLSFSFSFLICLSLIFIYAFWETYCTCFTDHCLVK